MSYRVFQNVRRSNSSPIFRAAGVSLVVIPDKCDGRVGTEKLGQSDGTRENPETARQREINHHSRQIRFQARSAVASDEAEAVDDERGRYEDGKRRQFQVCFVYHTASHLSTKLRRNYSSATTFSP